MNSPITNRGTVFVIKQLVTQKILDRITSVENSTYHSKNNCYTVLFRMETEEDGTLSNSFNEVSITLTQKQEKDSIKQEE